LRVADVDGDGRPEILSAHPTSVIIHEATSNNVYDITYTSGLASRGRWSTIGDTRVADSNGNGSLEFLIAVESSRSTPIRVFILEGTADDTYSLGTVPSATLDSGGGGALVAGAADLDGDGQIELVFSVAGVTYVYENSRFAFNTKESVDFPKSEFTALYLGDTDGNGKLEMIGRLNFLIGLGSPLLIFENTGDNAFSEVLNLRGFGQFFATDLNQDGQTELLRVLAGESEINNVLSLSTRAGDELQEVWNSGPLFQDSSQSIFLHTRVAGVFAMGDTDNNGSPEFAVLQGTTLHILEVDTRPTGAGRTNAPAPRLKSVRDMN
jgi:hypothetical protein